MTPSHPASSAAPQPASIDAFLECRSHLTKEQWQNAYCERFLTGGQALEAPQLAERVPGDVALAAGLNARSGVAAVPGKV